MPRILTLVAAFTLLAGCRPAPLDGPLVLSGNLELVDAQLSFKYPGRVLERLVDEGQRVKAGQPVARLDDSEQTQEVALRRAELAAARALLAELDLDVQVAALPAGDPWALTREVAALRSEGVEAHRIARAAIRVGACPGPATPAKVAACEARLRKDREQWRRRSRP